MMGKRISLKIRTRGILFLIASTTAVLTGFLTDNLTLLYTGSSFLILLAGSILGGGIIKSAWKRRYSERSVNFDLPLHGLYPDIQTSAYLTVPGTFPSPGFVLRFKARFQGPHDRSLRLQDRIVARKQEIPFQAPKRGRYLCVQAAICIDDMVGFTSTHIDLSPSFGFTVYPRATATETMPVIPKAGVGQERISGKRKGDELLELRKYYPGDDVRRINWKLYSHVQELFIRIVENDPPPSSDLLVVLDTGFPVTLPAEISGIYLDSLLEAASSIIIPLLMHRPAVMIAHPGIDAVHTVYSPQDVLELLGSISRCGGPPPLPTLPDLYTLVFSCPGSEALESILEFAVALHWSVELIYRKLETKQVTRNLKQEMRNLFFLSEPQEVPNLGILHTLVEEEARKFSQERWKLKDVKVI